MIAQKMIYAATSGDVVKVGISVDPERRMRHIGLELGIKFCVAQTWNHHRPRKVELTVRRRLKGCRVWGEEYFDCGLLPLVKAIDDSILDVDAGRGALNAKEIQLARDARWNAAMDEREAEYRRILAEIEDAKADTIVHG